MGKRSFSKTHNDTTIIINDYLEVGALKPVLRILSYYGERYFYSLRSGARSVDSKGYEHLVDCIVESVSQANKTWGHK